MIASAASCFVFFFNDTATTEIYTLSLHDALPILPKEKLPGFLQHVADLLPLGGTRSEEHTSELQPQSNRGCRLRLEKRRDLVEPQTALPPARPRPRDRPRAPAVPRGAARRGLRHT